MISSCLDEAIDRCKKKIDSGDMCDSNDVDLIIRELERFRRPPVPFLPIWSGLGTGD